MLDSLNTWIGNELAASQGLAALAWLFLGGSAASLLPCVYPVYPMTAYFLRSRAQNGARGWSKLAHPLVYYAGMGGMYLLFGVIAASTGGAFNEILRLPVSNMVIGTVMFLLALSTVDWIHLPLFGGQYDSNRKGLIGTLAMGAGAGLLSSACVGPIVVSILVAFATGTTEVSLGTVGLAGMKMAFFGFGVGLPILLIGVFGMQLPKGGKWMQSIQWAFGLVIAIFAWGYWQKALDLMGLPHHLVAWMLLLLVALRSLMAGEPVQRTHRALWAVAAFVAVLGSTRSVFPSVSSLPVVEATGNFEQRVGNLVWHLDKENAYAEAASSGKLVFIDFHADWCSNCKAFQAKTQEDSTLNNALQSAVLLKVYDTSHLFSEYRDSGKFPELSIGLPFFLITDSRGNVLYRTSDFTRTDEMVLFLTPD